MDYVDFALTIGPRLAENQYRVSARTSSLGEASGTFAQPLSDEQLELFVLKVGLARRSVRRIHSPEWRAAQDFGQKLFRGLFTEDIRAAFLSSHNDAVRQGKGLRIKLTLDAPELANYPWEFLYDPSSSQFLSLYEDTPIIRYVELSRPILPLVVTPPLRILAVAASPLDYEPLDLARERRNLSQALQELVQGGLVQLDWLPLATLDMLRSQLLKQQYHIFHFIGHGGFDPSEEDGILIFENADQRSNRVSGERLAVILGNHRTLRLATLNACEGARTSQQDPFAGTALTLVRTGNLPAVVAMQFEITDNAAINFARGFYAAIAAGKPVDAAVGQGRQAIFVNDNDIEWSTPVLYLRAPDGVIFNVDLARAAESARQIQADQAETQQLAKARAEQDKADRYESEPGETRALQREAQLNDLLARGQAAFDKGDWQTAIVLFEQLIAQDPSFRDAVTPMLEQARRGARDQVPSQAKPAESSPIAKPDPTPGEVVSPRTAQEELPAPNPAAVVALKAGPLQVRPLLARLGMAVLLLAVAAALNLAQGVAQSLASQGEYSPGLGTIALIPAMVIVAGSAGWFTSAGLRLLYTTLPLRQIATLVLGWGGAFFVGCLITVGPDTAYVRPVIIGALLGAVLVVVLWQSRICLNWLWLGGIFAGFLIGSSLTALLPPLTAGAYGAVEGLVSTSLDFVESSQQLMIKAAITLFLFSLVGGLIAMGVLFAYLRQRATTS